MAQPSGPYGNPHQATDSPIPSFTQTFVNYQNIPSTNNNLVQENLFHDNSHQQLLHSPSPHPQNQHPHLNQLSHPVQFNQQSTQQSHHQHQQQQISNVNHSHMHPSSAGGHPPFINYPQQSHHSQTHHSPSHLSSPHGQMQSHLLNPHGFGSQGGNAFDYSSPHYESPGSVRQQSDIIVEQTSSAVSVNSNPNSSGSNSFNSDKRVQPVARLITDRSSAPRINSSRQRPGSSSRQHNFSSRSSGLSSHQSAPRAHSNRYLNGSIEGNNGVSATQSRSIKSKVETPSHHDSGASEQGGVEQKVVTYARMVFESYLVENGNRIRLLKTKKTEENFVNEYPYNPRDFSSSIDTTSSQTPPSRNTSENFGDISSSSTGTKGIPSTQGSQPQNSSEELRTAEDNSLQHPPKGDLKDEASKVAPLLGQLNPTSPLPAKDHKTVPSTPSSVASNETSSGPSPLTPVSQPHTPLEASQPLSQTSIDSLAVHCSDSPRMLSESGDNDLLSPQRTPSVDSNRPNHQETLQEDSQVRHKRKKDESSKDASSKKRKISGDIEPEKEKEALNALISLGQRLPDQITEPPALSKPQSAAITTNVELADDASACSSSPSVHAQSFTQESRVFNDTEVKPTVLQGGTNIYAKWVANKIFYPATVIKPEPTTTSEAKWMVRFITDGVEKSVFETEIIKNQFLDVGQKCKFLLGSTTLVGTVVDHHKTEAGLRFTLAYFINGNQNKAEVMWTDTFLTLDQAAPLLPKPVKPPRGARNFADVDLENIIFENPARNRKTTQATEGSSSKSDSKKRGRVKSSMYHIDTDESSDEVSQVKSSSKQQRSHHKSGSGLGKKSTHSSNQVKSNAIKSSIKAQLPIRSVPDVVSAPAIENDPYDYDMDTVQETSLEAEKFLGPIPDHDLFKRYCFVINYDDKQDQVDGGEGHRSIPFNKKHLIQQIRAGGGIVFEDISKARAHIDQARINQNDQRVELVLISNTYHKSKTYFMCLASGIPCVSQDWVIQSCKDKELKPMERFLLPTGISKQTGALIASVKSKANILKDVKFMFVKDDPDSADDWSEVLRAAGAEVTNVLPMNLHNSSARKSINGDKFVVIVDSPNPDSLKHLSTENKEILRKAKQMKIPLVTAEYVEQCLINGRKLPTEKYRKDLDSLFLKNNVTL